MSGIWLALYRVQVSDRGVAPYYTAPVKTKSESSGEERSSGKATVEFLFQLGAEYLARLVTTLVTRSQKMWAARRRWIKWCNTSICKTVLKQISKHWEESWKYDAQLSINFLTIFEALGNVIKHLSWVFESKLKLRWKWRSKTVTKSYANWDQTSKYRRRHLMNLYIKGVCKSYLSLVVCVYHRSDLNASSGMASTLQQLASSSQWHPSVADHVGLCLERLAQPAAEVSLIFACLLGRRFRGVPV